MRLIDADALKQQVESPYTEYPLMIQIRRAIKEFIDSAPTIDIVRCKECWHHQYGDNLDDWCGLHDIGIYPDDFCSYGKRLTNTIVDEEPTPIRDYMVHGERQTDLGKLLKESDEQAKCPWR